MRDFSVQRSDIRRAFVKASVFAVSKQIALSLDGATERALESAGVRTVFFDSADEFELEGTVVLAFREEESAVAEKAAFFAAPASAPLEVKMRCAYVSSFDGETAAAEMADLIIAAKKS